MGVWPQDDGDVGIYLASRQKAMVGGRSFSQYGDCVQSFANVLFIEDSIFACKYMISFFHRPHLWNKGSVKRPKTILYLEILDSVPRDLRLRT